MIVREADVDINFPWGFSADDATRFATDYHSGTILLDDAAGRVRTRSPWSFDTSGLVVTTRDGTVLAAVDYRGSELLLADLTTLAPINTPGGVGAR